MRHASLLAVFLVACGGGSESVVTPPPAPAPVATVVLSSASLSITAGQVAQLSATLRDAQGNVLSGRTVTWSSTADGVASVSAGGAVTAVAPGTAQIRATSEGRTGDATVTVTGAPWTATGSLAIARTLHSATLLADGRVLVTGGQTVSAPFVTHASCEVFDPATGLWSATGSMATGRENHAAVRLPNGKILIVGGYSIEQQARLRSAELFDPTSGTWSSAGNMTVARDNPVAAVLADGTVLVSGGSTTGTGLDASSASEVYNPATGLWTAVGSMTVARAAHSGMVLANGKVLLSGGATGSFTTPQLHASAEVYDPVARTFAAVAPLATARGYHKSALLQNGKVLIVGGSDLTSTAFATAALYDVASNAWTSTATMSTARVSHTATVLANGRVLVAGGLGNGSGVLPSAEVYDPAAAAWVAAPPMRTARANHTAVLLPNGKVLVVGGQGAGAATSAELFDPSVVSPG